MAAKKQVDYLLVDISNSYTKLAFATTQRLTTTLRHPTAKLTTGLLRRILSRQNVRAIIVSSGAPQKNRVVAAAAAGSLRVLFLNPDLDLGVGIDYPSPKTIGADRLPKAAAGGQLDGYPALVVSFAPMVA